LNKFIPFYAQHDYLNIRQLEARRKGGRNEYHSAFRSTGKIHFGWLWLNS